MNKEDSQEEFKGKESDKTYIVPRRTFTPNDEAIHEILVKVLAKWRSERVSENEEWKETVILSSGKSIPQSAALPPNEERDELPETVIISPLGTTGRSVKPLQQPSSSDRKSLNETVAIQDGKKGPLTKKEVKKPLGQDLLTETVILQPKKEKGKKKDAE